MMTQEEYVQRVLELHHQRRRRRRCPGEQQRSVLGQFRPIVRHPADGGHRTQVEHREADLIIGAQNASAAVTIIDRAARCCLLGAFPAGHDAASVAWCVTRLLCPIPQPGRRTLT